MPASQPNTKSAMEPAVGKKELPLDCGNGIAMKLVLIPAGEFTMGSPDEEKGRSGDEDPQHRVVITKPFYMGAFDVTQAQYKAVMGENPSYFKGAENPVEDVSWNDAMSFCERLSEKTHLRIRLPTEAEWEYACRAGSRTKFSFGSDDRFLGDYGWYESNSSGKTHEVGLKKPNAWGLYDMQGNVWEKCQSLKRSYPFQVADGREDLNASGLRVLRGGSWYCPPNRCRSAYREDDGPTSADHGSGFRVVVSLQP